MEVQNLHFEPTPCQFWNRFSHFEHQLLIANPNASRGYGVVWFHQAAGATIAISVFDLLILNVNSKNYITNNKVTEIFCITDDPCIFFDAMTANNFIRPDTM